MSEFISKAKEQALLYYMAVAYVVLFSLGGLSSCIIASLIGSDWKTMDTQGKAMICFAVFSNWSTIMLAMLYRSMTKISKGELPISEGDSSLVSSRKVTTESTQQVTVQETPKP